MKKTQSKHYNDSYFDWQIGINEFGGIANSFRFSRHVVHTDTVIDFGCGGGYLLKEIKCSQKIGIEPNESTHEQIKENNVQPFNSPESVLEELGTNFADVIVSNNALEHSLHPLIDIQSLFPLLKKNGLIHFIVPCESVSYKWKKNDINKHLYSWSPMSLGNLFSEAGFKVEQVNPYIHKWPPYYSKIQQIFGWKVFELCCRIYGRIERNWYQVEIVARKV